MLINHIVLHSSEIKENFEKVFAPANQFNLHLALSLNQKQEWTYLCNIKVLHIASKWGLLFLWLEIEDSLMTQLKDRLIYIQYPLVSNIWIYRMASISIFQGTKN